MKSLKKLVVVVSMASILGVTGAAFAATAMAPAEIVAQLTGKSIADVNQERSGGNTYGTIAKEAGVLEEFKAQSLEQKKVVLDQRVEDGQLTQEQADEIYNNIKNNQATCDGSGNGKIGRKYGVGFGLGQGQGAGAGMRNGGGFGGGMGAGNGQNR
ncbi:hypothetical protein JCM14036_00430 [Desulfotomaculum defluvii]